MYIQTDYSYLTTNDQELLILVMMLYLDRSCLSLCNICLCRSTMPGNVTLATSYFQKFCLFMVTDVG